MKSLPNTAIAAIIALAITLLVAGLLQLPFFQSKELQTGDQMVYLRYHLQKIAPDPHLVFVAIDENSIHDPQVGAWPFPRYVHGQFLHLLSPEKPKVVAWDILFTEAKASDPNAAPVNGAPPLHPDDQALVDGISLFPHVVAASKRSLQGPPVEESELPPTRPLKNVQGDRQALLSSKSAELPFPALRQKSYFGFVDENGDMGGSGGGRRLIPLVLNINGLVLPSFDLQILMQYWGIEPDQVAVDIGRAVTLKRPDGSQVSIPIDAHGQFIINYRLAAEDFRTQALSYNLMALGLADKANNQASEERNHLPAVGDNIVVIGVTFAGTDAGPTPLNPATPLVLTHLNTLNNILQHDFLLPVSGWIWMPVYALLLFGLGYLMLRSGTGAMIAIVVGGMILVPLAAFGALWLQNFLMPVVMPEVGLLLMAAIIPAKRFFGEEREKLLIKGAMRAYLSDKVMQKVLEHPDNVKLGGVKQEITIMFCDIRGFTKYCDDRDSQEVLTVLNEYMEEMTQVVFKYDGTVDKYIGDCIMAFWNAPELQSDHAQRAVCCAMEMRYALANFKTKRAGKDTELFECGIGIHTGEALVGNMGSSLKLNYTAMGSTVNMGARLESLTKRLNERILISEDTLKQLQGDFPITDRGEAVVPGFARPIHVYAVGADQDISAALNVGRTLAGQQEYTAEEASEPIWKPAPLPEDADPQS